jgi:hypothetical protein
MENAPEIADLDLQNKTLSDADKTAQRITEYRAKYRHLVWSNHAAPDEIYIRKGLIKADFFNMLDAAVAFGIDRLFAEWKILCESDNECDIADVSRARFLTENSLSNIKRGYEIFKAKNSANLE